MNPISQPLLIPLTFPTVSKLNREQDSQTNILEIGCSTADPTMLVSWGFSEHCPDESGEIPSKGLIMGCKDGTLYTFLPAPTPPAPSISQQHHPRESAASHQSSSPFQLSRHSRSGSRSDSPSSPTTLQVPFLPRSRVVSGLSPEKVEAPKNLVDSEDLGKLREMLKGRSKDRVGNNDGVSASSDIRHVPPVLPFPVMETGESALKRKLDPRSLLSATNSPAFSPQSLSSPASPKLPPTPSATNFCSNELYLHCHVIAPGSADGPVTGIYLIGDRFATLQSSGDLCVLNVQDGTCVATAKLEDPPVRSASESQDRSTQRHWTWTRLQALNTHEATLLFVFAKVDESYGFPLPDTSEDKSQEPSRLAVFEYHPGNEWNLFQVKLDSIGDWNFGGPVNACDVEKESDASFTVFFLDSQGQLIKQSARLLGRFAEPPSEPDAVEPLTGNLMSLPLPLPLPNPFKGIMMRSTEQLPPPAEIKPEPGRIQIEEECNIGQVLTHGHPVGLRTRPVGGGSRGIAWSDEEFSLFEHRNHSLHILAVFRTMGILDVTWVDDDSYTVTRSDRIDHYILEWVKGNKEDASVSYEPQFAQSRLSHTISMDPFHAIHHPSAREVVSTNLCKDGHRQIVLVRSTADKQDKQQPSSETQKSRLLWRASGPRKSGVDSTRPQLTAVLSIGMDAIILGYDDGRIRRSTLSQMAENVHIEGS